MMGLAVAVLGLAVPFQYLPLPAEAAAATGEMGKPSVIGSTVDLRLVVDSHGFPLDLGLATVAAAQVVKGREGQGGNTCPHLLRQCYRPFALERAC